jgi:hypothetical protein
VVFEITCLKEQPVPDESFVHWLLNSESPSIRYLTLTTLLDRPDDDAEVSAARRAIMQEGLVPAILAHQDQDGHIKGERNFYKPFYTSTHWSMLLLTELAADPADGRLQRGAEFILAATEQGARLSHKPERQDWVCVWGNLLRYLAYCGRADDPRVEVVVETLALAAGPRGWGCRYNGQLACAWGAARPIWGLAGLPADLRTPQVEAAAASGIRFLLEGSYSLLKADYPTPGKIHPLWGRINFPLFYQVDILFTLRALADLGALDHPGAQPALDWLEDRRQSSGHWQGSSSYQRHTWPDLGETDRWVSLHAARVLKEAGRWS